MSSTFGFRLTVFLAVGMFAAVVSSSLAKRSTLGALRAAYCTGVRCPEGCSCGVILGQAVCRKKDGSGLCQGIQKVVVGNDGKSGFGCSFEVNNCQVTLASHEVCQSNPCLTGEYCKIHRGSLRCCQQLSVSDSIPSVLRTSRRCSESCVLPPRYAPSPPLSVCPSSQTLKPSVLGDPEPSTVPPVVTTPSEMGASNSPTPTLGCPTPTAPRNGKVTVTVTIIIIIIAGYRCREGYRIAGNSTRRCVDGEWEGKTPRCKRASVGNGRCFVSFEGCTTCLRSRKVCNQGIQLKCPGGSYCKVIGSRKLPTCCSLNEDAFGRCSESCI